MDETDFDLTREEFERLFDAEAAALDSESQAILEKHAVPVFKAAYEFAGVSGRATSPVWVVARAGEVVLGYDEAEEEYGTGTLRPDGLVDNWGTFGERLRWTLIRFPDRAQH